MKKIALIVLLFGFLTSCGPHRMKCGPGRRCLVENKVISRENITQQKNS